MTPPTGTSVRLGDPLRRALLEDLGRRVRLPEPLVREWAAPDAELLVGVAHPREGPTLVLAAGTLEGPRRWKLRQHLDRFDDGDLFEAWVSHLRAAGHGDRAPLLATRATEETLGALADALEAAARARPERGAVLFHLGDALRAAEPPADDTPAEPPADDTPAEPPADDTPAEPPVGRAPARPAAPTPRQPTRGHSTRGHTPRDRASGTSRRRLGRLGAVAALLAILVGGAAAVGPIRTIEAADPAATEQASVAESDPDFAVTLRHTDGSPVRMEPCRTYEYVVQPGGLAPRTAAAEAGAAVAALEEASGLGFRFAGFTDERFPHPVEPAAPPRRPVLVSFESSDDSTALREGGRDHDVPEGVPVGGLAVSGPVRVGAELVVLAGGAVVVDEGLAPDQRGRVLLHELGHLVGLDHASDPEQLMAPSVPAGGPVSYRSGDRAGLAAVGADGGCVLDDEQRAAVFAPEDPAGEPVAEPVTG